MSCYHYNILCMFKNILFVHMSFSEYLVVPFMDFTHFVESTVGHENSILAQNARPNKVHIYDYAIN